jgi:hypothetical protein
VQRASRESAWDTTHCRPACVGADLSKNRTGRTWSRSTPCGTTSFFLPLQYSILINGGLPTQVSTRGQRDGIVLSPVGLWRNSDAAVGLVTACCCCCWSARSCMRKVNALTVASASSAAPAPAFASLLSSERAQGRKRTWMERMEDQFERRDDVCAAMPESAFVSGEDGGEGGHEACPLLFRQFRATAVFCSPISGTC